MHASLAPSPWVRRWAHLLRANSRVLDVACGSGRHVRWLAAAGHVVTGIDRDATAIAQLRQALQTQPFRGATELMEADLESAPWPCAGRQFDAVVVVNYLWRPLWPHLLAALAPNGWLLYETFAAGNESVGRPARADFLLQPGELLQRCSTLRVVAYEDGFLSQPDRFVQRIAAVRPASVHPSADAPAGAAAHAPPRWPLVAPG